MSEDELTPENANANENEPADGKADGPESADPGRADLIDEDVAPGADGAADGAGPSDPIAELQAEVAALNDKLLRAMAETENVRKRSETARKDAYARARADFARDILDVADNMERALAAVSADDRKASDVVENLYVGVDMTQRALMAAFDRAGIQPIAAEGTPFNPTLHEAMFEVPAPDAPEGIVVQVIRTGYTLGDFLVRPAQVGVARGGPKPEASPDAEAPDAQGAYGDGEAAEKGGQLDEEL